MLSDYIPVYFPATNEWSIPARELEKYHDYDTEPQEIELYGAPPSGESPWCISARGGPSA